MAKNKSFSLRKNLRVAAVSPVVSVLYVFYLSLRILYTKASENRSEASDSFVMHATDIMLRSELLGPNLH